MATRCDRVVGRGRRHARGRQPAGGPLTGRRRALGLGVAALAAYVGVLALTVGGGAGRPRPLYDGFAPAASYQWVHPPAFYAAGNTAPAPSSSTIPLGPRGSAAAGIATPDGQLALSLGPGAIAPHANARRVAVRITPLDPRHLAPVPAGLRANGNGYRVEMTYEPGHVAVGPLRDPGSLVLQVPEIGRDLFVTRPGPGWARVPAQPVPPRDLSLNATFATPGEYLAATDLPQLVAPSTGSSGAHAVALGVGAAVLTAVVLGGAVLVVRRRSRRAGPHTARGA